MRVKYAICKAKIDVRFEESFDIMGNDICKNPLFIQDKEYEIKIKGDEIYSRCELGHVCMLSDDGLDKQFKKEFEFVRFLDKMEEETPFGKVKVRFTRIDEAEFMTWRTWDDLNLKEGRIYSRDIVYLLQGTELEGVELKDMVVYETFVNKKLWEKCIAHILD